MRTMLRTLNYAKLPVIVFKESKTFRPSLRTCIDTVSLLSIDIKLLSSTASSHQLDIPRFY
jgi:hypothetical protein